MPIRRVDVARWLASARARGGVPGAIALFVYLSTLAPSVDFIDSGELSAVACTLGVAHPTGYPLFTLVGHVFCALPIAHSPVTRLNLMAALFCAAGVVVFFNCVRVVIESSLGRTRRWSQRLARRPYLVETTCTAAALLLGFSETYWQQAVSVEVYSLHMLMLSLVALTFLRAALIESSTANDWALAAFTLGLSFTNHMTTVLLVPGIVVLIGAKLLEHRFEPPRLIVEPLWKMAAAFGVGLLPYIYLPLRACTWPALNWGNPDTLERFIAHLRGKQYSVWIFSSTDATSRQLAYFFGSFPSEFAYVGLVLAALGLYVLAMQDRRLLTCTVVWFVSCVAFAINYDIKDIDSYFLLAYWVTALWAGVGLVSVLAWLARTFRPSAWALAGATALVPAAPLMLHRSTVDESEDHLVEDYTHNMFASFAQHAVVISYQWDYWVSAAEYYQLVEHVRPDVTVIDKELLRRSWYLDQLEHHVPWLIDASRTEVQAFRQELVKFEQDTPYEPAVIQERFVAMIQSFIRKSLESHPVYVTHEVEPEFTQGLQRSPEGLAFRIWNDNAFHPTPLPHYSLRRFDRRGLLEDAIQSFYTTSLVNRGRYLYLSRSDDAQNAFQAALALDPQSKDAQQGLEQIRMYGLPPQPAPPMPMGLGAPAVP